MKRIVIILLFLSFACKDNVMPKPKAYLRLEYPTPEYKITAQKLPFTFEKNKLALESLMIKKGNDNLTTNIDVVYPTLKGTIYLTYKSINEDNLELHLKDAQNITQKHTQKADEIIEQPFINSKNRVFGMFYEVGGNAASQSQFYVTDSTHHFLTGSLYFYVKPNYDSILPASEYLKNDIRHIMETIKWKQ